MTKDLLDSGELGAEEARKAPASGVDDRQLALLERKLLQRVEKKLEELQEKSLESHAAKTKTVLAEIVQSVLFESGLMEKVVQRAVEKKLKEGGIRSAGGTERDGSGAKPGDGQSQKEIEAIVKNEVLATLSGETVKVLIDDKFRAITLYLKTDVIPKAIGQALKSQKQPA